MADTTQPESAGEQDSASSLLPYVYDDLRRVARARMAGEAKGHSMQATALVHEAYMRARGPQGGARWNGPGHFFASVSLAMRRILIEDARRRRRQKRGWGLVRQELDASLEKASAPNEALLALDAALEELTKAQPRWAELVNLRAFLGLTIPEAAQALGISPRTADAWWAAARQWLRQRLDLALEDFF